MADYIYLLESRLSQAQQRAIQAVREIARTKGLTVFLVGGASGPPAEWRHGNATLLSLSAMTFAHEVARVMLAEQIYRALATLRGHPYAK